jgi:hypothetical protein
MHSLPFTSTIDFSLNKEIERRQNSTFGIVSGTGQSFYFFTQMGTIR